MRTYNPIAHYSVYSLLDIYKQHILKILFIVISLTASSLFAQSKNTTRGNGITSAYSASNAASLSSSTSHTSPNEIAHWLAGQPNNISDKNDPVWTAHADKIRKAWATRDKQHFQKIEQWQANQLKDTNTAVFYPFGGPDVAHAIALFPNAQQRVLFGLEPIGRLASPSQDNAATRAIGLKNLQQSLSGVLGRNFFKTLDMGREVGESPYHGVTAIALFFLASQGQNIGKVQPVTINKEGVMVNVSWEQADGVNIEHDKNGILQTMLYFSWDISDASLAKHPERVRWLKLQKGHTTLLKAASYLNWRPDFSTIRSFILNQSTRVVTDSSGLPYEALSGWKISLYGKYRGPISLFSSRLDLPLIKAFKESPYQPLPFLFGYGNGSQETHVMVADRTTPLSDLIENHINKVVRDR